MVSLEVIAILLSGISISASLVYYASVLRNQNETRQAQLFMQVFQEMNTERFWGLWIEQVSADIPDYETFLEKYDSTINRQHFAERTKVWYVFTAIGELVRKGILSIETVEPLIAVPVVTLWEKWGKIIEQIRIDIGLSRNFEGFEYLYGELMKYYEKHPELMIVDRDVFSKAKY